MSQEKLELVTKHIKSYPNFPKEGIIFRDIFGVFANPEATKALFDLIEAQLKPYEDKIEAVLGLESRGFLIGPQVAWMLNIPFIPLRKAGKLPGDVKSLSFQLEYGADIIEIQTGMFRKKLNVLIVDDLLATGGTLDAACRLVESLGSRVEQCLVVIELLSLDGRKKLNAPLHSIVQL